MAGDVLLVSGDVQNITDDVWLSVPRELSLAGELGGEGGDKGVGGSFFELDVGPCFPSLGVTMRSCRFRSRYGAAILGVHE
jgi:hypothetical protein